MSAMSDESRERIELKIAYLESANQAVSDVVYRQQREIDALRERVGMLADRLESLLTVATGEDSAMDPAAERPPHY